MMEESNFNILYHGISFMYFDKIIAVFNSPTSTTTKLQIAMIFAKNDGIILESKKDSLGWTRYFNCSLVSCFPHENERLFVSPPGSTFYSLEFNSIRIIETNENYSVFIKALVHLQKIISCEEFEDSFLNDIETINSLFTSNITSNYIINTFQKWTQTITDITLDTNDILKYGKELEIFSINNIGYKTYNNLIPYHKINKIFKQVEWITCSKMGEINVLYLKSLLSILKLVNNIKYSKLNCIELRDVNFMYSMSEFAEYKDLFVKNGWKIERDEYNDIVITRC